MSRHHFIDGTIDPKSGSFVRVTASGSDLEDVLKAFCERARFVAAHTEAQLQKIHKKTPELISDIGQER